MALLVNFGLFHYFTTISKRDQRLFLSSGRRRNIIESKMDAVFLIAILIMSVVIHEVAHGYAANILGDPTARLSGRLSLNPLRHLDLFGSVILPFSLFFLSAGRFVFGWAKPVPFNPFNLRFGRFGPALVAAAGPFANLVLAAVFSVFLRWGVSFGFLSPAAAGLAGSIVFVNIILAVFNLVPVPPLDGSKILFALLPLRYEFVEEWLIRYQFIVFIILLFLLFNFSFLDKILIDLFRLFTGSGF